MLSFLTNRQHNDLTLRSMAMKTPIFLSLCISTLIVGACSIGGQYGGPGISQVSMRLLVRSDVPGYTAYFLSKQGAEIYNKEKQSGTPDNILRNKLDNIYNDYMRESPSVIRLVSNADNQILEGYYKVVVYCDGYFGRPNNLTIGDTVQAVRITQDCSCVIVKN